MLGRHRKKDSIEDHEVTLNRAGQNGQAISIPQSKPNGLWNQGVRGETGTFHPGAIRVTDPEAAREEFLARATERAQRSHRQRESVTKARATGYQLGLEQGRELGRSEAERKQRQAENAEFDREQDKLLKRLVHPPLQAMIKHHGPATVVQLATIGNDGVRDDHMMMSTGIAVCAPCDVYDRTIGTQIAYARALRGMADLLEEGAASRTRHVKERY